MSYHDCVAMTTVRVCGWSKYRPREIRTLVAQIGCPLFFVWIPERIRLAQWENFPTGHKILRLDKTTRSGIHIKNNGQSMWPRVYPTTMFAISIYSTVREKIYVISCEIDKALKVAATTVLTAIVLIMYNIQLVYPRIYKIIPTKGILLSFYCAL